MAPRAITEAGTADRPRRVWLARVSEVGVLEHPTAQAQTRCDRPGDRGSTVKSTLRFPNSLWAATRNFNDLPTDPHVGASSVQHFARANGTRPIVSVSGETPRFLALGEPPVQHARVVCAC